MKGQAGHRDMLDAFKELTMLELSEFVKKFEANFEGHRQPHTVAVAAAGHDAGATHAEAAEEQ